MKKNPEIVKVEMRTKIAIIKSIKWYLDSCGFIDFVYDELRKTLTEDEIYNKYDNCILDIITERTKTIKKILDHLEELDHSPTWINTDEEGAH